MPTNKPRIFVTFDPDLLVDIRKYMFDHSIKSHSLAISSIVSQFLSEYFEHQSYGVTLFDKNFDPLDLDALDL